MVIHSPIFSGSIIQDRNNAYADLSGSFTGSLTGSFKGTIDVSQASFDYLNVNQRLYVSGSQIVSGSIYLTQGGYLVDGVNVLDSAIAFAIALG
jgi:hypothetical protein